MSGTPDPRFGFNRVFINRSFTVGQIPWTTRLLLILLMPLVLLLVLGLVFLGLVIFGVFFLIQVVSALLFGKVSTRVTVNRQEIFPNAKPGLAFDETSIGDETGNGQVIDILPEPKKERQ
jgi:hypothetical protein